LLTVNTHKDIASISATQWNKLLEKTDANPFIRHEYLLALENSQSVKPEAGWTPCHFTIWDDELLVAAMPLYLKTHSYGEYVFDWAWANAYEENGLSYYPKLLCAIPFTPVEGARILGDNEHAKALLIESIKTFTLENKLSSIHILFPEKKDAVLLETQGWMRRESIQFHWQNQSISNPGAKLESFEEFLYTLNKKRRNNILRERRSIEQSHVKYRHIAGSDISVDDWHFFYSCYANTYFNHRSSPYLSKAFFLEIGVNMPEYLHLIIAELDGQPIASSLVFRNRDKAHEKAYGRYWGTTQSISNLHFETAYYQVIDWCIKEKIAIFEGGAQGEHKIHRGMIPVNLHSYHYLSDDRFAKAVENFLKREGQAMYQYMNELEEHIPIKKSMHSN
jgi:predicted N-acyltransferase